MYRYSAEYKYMHFLAALILAIVTPAPLQSAAPPVVRPVVIGSVALGQSAVELVARTGEPYAARMNGGDGLWAYLSPGGSAIEFVAIRSGHVTGAALIARSADFTLHEDLAIDGVHLGDAYSDLPAYANTGTVTMDGVVYTFGPTKDKSKVFSMGAHLTDDRVALLAPLSSMPVLHDGSSLADAIVVKANSDILGTMFEHAFVSAHNYCTKPGNVKFVKQSLLHDAGKSYDQIDTACDNSEKTRTYYFDVTDSIGKE